MEEKMKQKKTYKYEDEDYYDDNDEYDPDRDDY